MPRRTRVDWPFALAQRAREPKLRTHARLGPHAARAERAQPGLAHAHGQLGGLGGILDKRLPVSREARPCLLERHKRCLVGEKETRTLPILRPHLVSFHGLGQRIPAPAVERRAKARLGRNETGDDARDKDQQEHARRDAAPHQHARAHPQIGPHSHG